MRCVRSKNIAPELAARRLGQLTVMRHASREAGGAIRSISKAGQH